MKKLLPLFLLVAVLYLPQPAYAGLSEGCFPIVQCNSGEDFYGGACQAHIETLTGATDSCESVNGAPSAGKSWAFSCNAGCYEKGGSGGTVNLCPGGVMVGANCMIKLEVLDDDVHATNEAYKIYDGTDLTELVHVDTAGCSDTQIAVSDSASPTGWSCAVQPISPWNLNGSDVYYNAGNVGIGDDTPVANLNVVGNSRASNEAAETNYTEMGHNGTDGYLNTVGTGRLDFQHDGTSLVSLLDSGRVGVGDTDPATNFNVVGNIRASNEAGESNYLEIDHDGSNAIVNTVGTGRLDFQHDGVSELSLLDSGNFGVGTINPQSLLHVSGGHMRLGAEGFDSYIQLTSDGLSDATTVRLKSLDTVGLAVTDSADTPHVVVETTGQVGIGRTDPRTSLEAVGTLRAASAAAACAGSANNCYSDLSHAGSGGLVLNSRTGGTWADLSFQANGTTRMFIESAGNVGIGTTSPSARLHAIGSTYGVWGEGTTMGGRFEDSDGTGYAYVGYGNLGIDARGSSGGGQFRDTSGTATTYIANGTAGINASGQSYGGLFQDTDQGIWTYAGFGGWSVYGNGNLRVDNAFLGEGGHGSSYMHLAHDNYQGAGQYALLQHGTSGHTYLNSVGSGDLWFRNNNSTRMVIEDGGDVGIGTTNPNSKLHVVNGSNTFTAGGGSTGITANGTGWGAIITGGTQSKYAWLAYSGYTLLGNGIVSGSSWQTSSDLRLKDVIGDYESGLNEVMALDTVEFKYKDGNELGLGSDTLHVGLIAQDVQKVIPEAVSIGRKETLSLEPNVVSMTMLNAIQELKVEKDAEIAELKSIVCELKPDAKVCQ